MACATQLRIAGARIVGLDHAALLQAAAARGLDSRAVAELLPAAEAGMLEALAERQDEERE